MRRSAGALHGCEEAFWELPRMRMPWSSGPKKEHHIFRGWLGDPAAVDTLWLCQQFAIENGDLNRGFTQL